MEWLHIVSASLSSSSSPPLFLVKFVQRPPIPPDHVPTSLPLDYYPQL